MYIPLILAETAANAAESHSVAAAVPHLLGMLLVVLTLAALWGVCVLSATLIVLSSTLAKTFASAPAAPAPAQAAPKPASVTDDLSPELVAVISAAVAAVTDSAHRIVAIKPQSSTWSKAGRQSVLSSHKIR